MRSLGPMRSLAVAILTGLAVLGIFALWLRWPINLSIIAGAIFSLAFLMIAASIGDDPGKADAAWRAVASDLTSPPREAPPPNAADRPSSDAG
jgi:hypothetical protein